jgi:hypothetical protein
VRLALSADGMNSFDKMTNSHSIWLVILSIYNIPSLLCHKRKYLMQNTLIFGLKQAVNDIHAFSEPLIEDMSGIHTDNRASPPKP